MKCCSGLYLLRSRENTSLVAAVKATNESREVLEGQQWSREELARALDVVSKAIHRQATAVESLSAGVGYNTSRVGAITGEIQKVRRWVEWFSTRTLNDFHSQSTKLSKEQEEKLTETLGTLTAEIKGMFEGIIMEVFWMGSLYLFTGIINDNDGQSWDIMG